METFPPLLEKIDLELLEKTKNFLSAEKDKNSKNMSKDYENPQTKATSNINSMATREYITRNKAKEPYNYTFFSLIQKKQKKHHLPRATTTTTESDRDKSRDANA